MKVLMVIDRYIPIWGGAENQLRQLIPHLKKLGCEISIVTRRWHKDMAGEGVVDDTPVRRVGIAGAGILATFWYIICLSVYVLRRGMLTDVIHTHGAAVLGAGGSFFARATKSRNVALIGTAGKIPRLKKSLTGRVVLKILKQSDVIVCLSGEIEKELEDIGTGPRRVFRIGNAVDTDRFSPMPAEKRRDWRAGRGFGRDEVIVVFSARIVHRKGLDVLLEAWKQVIKNSVEARLIILGSGRDQPDSIEEEMRREVECHGIPRVTFEGNVDDAETYFGAADIFALPSRKEGLPNALLEAMSSGLAPVCSEIGGVTDLITNGENGLLVPRDDPAALARALNTLLDDPEKRKQLGQRARSYVAAHHGFDRIAKEYFTVYGREGKE